MEKASDEAHGSTWMVVVNLKWREVHCLKKGAVKEDKEEEEGET